MMHGYIFISFVVPQFTSFPFYVHLSLPENILSITQISVLLLEKHIHFHVSTIIFVFFINSLIHGNIVDKKSLYQRPQKKMEELNKKGRANTGSTDRS